MPAFALPVLGLQAAAPIDSIFFCMGCEERTQVLMLV